VRKGGGEGGSGIFDASILNDEPSCMISAIIGLCNGIESQKMEENIFRQR